MFKRTTVIGELAPGPAGLLTSPLTGAQCVWYQVKVESWQARADLHHRQTVCLRQKGNPFSVRGAPHTTLVNADLIRVDGPPVTTFVETVRGKRPPQRSAAPLLYMLVDSGLVPESALRRRAHLFDELVWQTTECYLLPGQRVAASGRLDRRSVLRHSLLTRSGLVALPRG